MLVIMITLSNNKEEAKTFKIIKTVLFKSKHTDIF